MKNKENELNPDDIQKPVRSRQQQNENEVDFLDKLKQSFENNRVAIIAVSAVVIIAIVAVWYFQVQKTENIQKASLALSRVMPFYEEGNFEAALNGDQHQQYRGESVKGLIHISNEYSSNAPGQLAAFYTANIYMSQDDYQEAKKYFEIASKSKAEIVKAGANAGLARIAENEGKYEQAANMYLSAAELVGDTEIKLRYYFYAALCYEKIGDNKNAEKYYQEIILDQRRTEFTGLAKANLARIGTVIE